MLIGDDPNQGKTNTFDPYSAADAGPLVAATLYRKYEYAEASRRWSRGHCQEN